MPTAVSSDSPSRGWYCVRSQVRREQIAAEHLCRIPGVQVFAPRVRFRRSTRRGAVWFEEALFPGYLFAAFEWSDLHRLARYAPGVTGFIHFGGEPSTVPDEEIQTLRRNLPADGVKVFEDPLREGERAVVTEGPLRGLEIVVKQAMPAADRVRALFEFLGQSTELVIERKHLERVPSAGSVAGGPGGKS